MPSPKREIVEVLERLERLERLVAVAILRNMGDAKQRDRVMVLNLAGFSNIEVADLLETTPAVVAQVLYETRKNPRGAKGRKARD